MSFVATPVSAAGVMVRGGKRVRRRSRLGQGGFYMTPLTEIIDTVIKVKSGASGGQLGKRDVSCVIIVPDMPDFTPNS